MEHIRSAALFCYNNQVTIPALRLNIREEKSKILAPRNPTKK